MPTRQVELQFPIAGLNRAWPYQSQPPFSTPDALNVRPFDTLEGRGRGGSRPGLYRYGRPTTKPGGGRTPLNMLAQLHYVSAAGRQFWRDDFDGTTLGPNWSAQDTTTTDSLIMMPYSASTPWLTYQQNSALLPAESPTKAFIVELLCVPHEGSYAAEYQIVVCVDPSDPDPETDGITITFTIGSDGHWSGTCQQYVAGILTHDYTLAPGIRDTACYPGWLRVRVLPGTSKIEVWWNGDLILPATQAITAPTTNIGWGFGGRATTSGGYANIEAVRYIWQPEVATPIPQVGLIAATNGTCYRTSWLNNWEAMTGATVSPTEMLQAAEHGGQLYIADHGVGTISGEEGQIIYWTYIQLFDPDAPFASVTTSDFVVITASSTGQWRGTYRILEVIDASHLKLDGKLPSLPTGATVTYSIVNAPRVANLNQGTVAVWTATTGSVPANCPIIFAYADRIVLAGSPPEFWYMSRKGDPYDWNFGIELTDDPAAAVFGTIADAGQMAGAITAGVAFSDDYAILATATEIWIMRGDPGYGGSLGCVSRTVGIVGRFALCQTPEQELVFLSRDGLYLLAPGGSAYPVPLSRDKLPLELRDLSSDRYTVQMAYDVRDRGVHIFITGNPALDGVPTGDRSHWWFDWPTKSFWPVTFDSHDYDPVSLLTFEAGDGREAGPLLGCADGYIRQFYRRAEGDDTARMTNWVYYGPIRLGPNGYDGILHEMIATLGDKSGPVAWEVYVGDTPQDAITAAKAGTSSAAATGTWSAEGLNYNTLVRRRGAAMILKLKNDTTTHRRWTVENLIARIQPGGPVRKA